MIDKKEIVNSSEQLLQAREQGLKQAQQVDTMQAHGKILGMDTFSWMNPHVDMLATLLASFPFSILWIGTQRQIGLEHAFEFVRTMKLKKGVLMYTNEDQTAISDKGIFEEFVQIYR